ncbi:hypothetical protein V8D89_000174 [Ganoderma adspersum]
MPRSPSIEAEVAGRPDTFLVAPDHSTPPHEPSHSIPPPSRPLGLHLRQATLNGVPNPVPITTTDTSTTTLFSTEIMPSQPSLHVSGVLDDGEAVQKWNQAVAFEGTQPTQAPMTPPGQTFPSQSKQPVPAVQPSTLDSDVILKLLRDNREEQQTILEQQREILACLRGQRDVHQPHADALARLEQTLQKGVIPLMKKIAQAFVSDFSPTASDVGLQVPPVNSPHDGPPIRALNMFAVPGRISQAEPSSSYGQFPVGGPASAHPSPTSEYFPEPLKIRRIRTEFRSPPPSPSEPDAVPWDVEFEAGSNDGSMGGSESQDAEETEEQTHYRGFSRGIDSRSRQQLPVAQEVSRHMEVPRWELDLDIDLDDDPIAERVPPLEGVAQAMLETPLEPSTWSRAIESISDSESVPPQAQAPTWRVQPRERDRIAALENELAAMRQQLDSDRALRMVELERQINSNVASWGDILEQACQATSTPSLRAGMHTVNADNTPEHEPPPTVGPEGQRRRPQPQALNAAERQRIIFEGSIRNMTETWHAEWERGKVEIIEAIKAAANKPVPYNIQAWHPPSTDADELPLPPEEGSNLANPASPILSPVPEILSGQCESSLADPLPPRSEETSAAGMPNPEAAVTSPTSDAPASPSQFDIIDAPRAAQEQLSDTTPSARPQGEDTFQGTAALQ